MPFFQTIQTLDAGWSFAGAPPGSFQTPKVGWRPARVPGNVHLDLVAAGRLPDPCVGKGEAASAWVEQRDWWYRCRFRAIPDFTAASRVRLMAEGLDTWC
ncbi:MAG: glycosyl hydrolase 2 galactose-binding domain-containing protein, partial [bacterium]